MRGGRCRGLWQVPQLVKASACLSALTVWLADFPAATPPAPSCPSETVQVALSQSARTPGRQG